MIDIIENRHELIKIEIFLYLRTYGSITIKQARKLNVTENTLNKWFHLFLDNNYVSRIKVNTHYKYKLTEKGVLVTDAIIDHLRIIKSISN
jgi:CTP-dependent riboflavin kinase